MDKPSEENRKFNALLNKVLSVSKEEILKREKEYNAAAERNPCRRGRKRKAKPAASPDPDV
jgi:hypothetical protein